MRAICSRSFRSFSILILIGIGIGTLTATQSARAADAAPTTYPEIVRLTYVEGDVRVSRGKPGEKAHEGEAGATGWEQASAGLPLQSGYSLVTGKGRAEIELEDASTVYLRENSVLTFDELTATASVPCTELSLLSGAATMNVHATLPGESFRINTPTEHISVIYPHGGIWRVDSYLDAVSVTPLQDLAVIQPGTAAPAQGLPGKTVSYSHGHVVAVPMQPDAATSAAWDQWVAARILARDAAMSAAMKQAGLTAPLPGLDQMNGKGSFFACAPYGTCWAPTNGWDGKSPGDANAAPAISSAMPTAIRGRVQPARLLTVSQIVEQADPAVDQSQPPASASGSSKKSARLPGQSAEDAFLAAHPGATFYAEDYTFPCGTDSVIDLIGVDPITGREAVVDSELDPFALDALFRSFPHRGFYPFLGYDAYWDSNAWDWTVCHTGAWIRWRHRYAWVAGNKRHHRPPVRWVKSGRTVGFVPIHPRDVADKPPLNLKSGLFHVTGKDGRPIERVSFKDSDSLKLLTEPPKEFREPPLEPLKIAEVPRPEAHSAWSAALASRSAADHGQEHIPTGAHGTVVNPAGKSLVAREQGVPITFDRKTQSFSVARQVSGGGGRTATVATPLGGGRGNAPGGNGFSGSRGGGSNSGGSSASRAGGSSGGGSSSTSRGGGGGGGSSSASASRGGGGGGGGGGFSGGGGGGGGGGGASHAGGGGSAPSGGGGGASSHK